MSAVTLGLLQHACRPDPAANLAKALELAGKAADAGARIICTQELFRSLYFCQSEDYANFSLAEPIPGPTTEIFQRFARERGVVVIVSLFEKRASGPLPQHGRRHRCGRRPPRRVPQDAPPGRSALLREILFLRRATPVFAPGRPGSAGSAS